ncbi:hypothetical protein D3C77_487580 [compost metagenome]
MQVQPARALGGFLIGQHAVQRVRLQLGFQALQLLAQLLLLVQVFLDLAIDATQLGAQLVQLLFQLIDRVLGVVLLVLVMSTQALQQGFGLIIGMLLAATYRARLAVFELGAEVFNALAAGQALTLQQLPGDCEGLFGSRQSTLGVQASTDQLFTLLKRNLLARTQGVETLFEILLLSPQMVELIHLTLLLAIFL